MSSGSGTLNTSGPDQHLHLLLQRREESPLTILGLWHQLPLMVLWHRRHQLPPMVKVLRMISQITPQMTRWIAHNVLCYCLHWFQRQTPRRCQVLVIRSRFAQFLTVIDLVCAYQLLCCVEGKLASYLRGEEMWCIVTYYIVYACLHIIMCMLTHSYVYHMYLYAWYCACSVL